MPMTLPRRESEVDLVNVLGFRIGIDTNGNVPLIAELRETSDPENPNHPLGSIHLSHSHIR